MVGTFFQLTLVGLLAAGPAGGFSFESHEASARTTSPVGFFAQGPTPYPPQWERGYGSASLSAEDRVSALGASYGDTGRFEAEFRLGEVRYRVELDEPGFPPAHASGEAAARLAALRPGFPIGGGVILDRDLNGGSGIGWSAATQVHAAVAMWGVGSVWRNGQLLTDSAVIQAAALSHGAQADDETHSNLPVARAGDTELDVIVWNLPLSAEPRGFLQFSFDDVEINLAGQTVPSVAVLPNVVGLESGQSMPAAGAFGANGLFLPTTPVPPPGEGVGGSGFNVNATPETGQPGGPVTPVGPTTLSGPASPNPSVVPGLSVGTEATRIGTAVPGIPGVPTTPITGPVTGTTPVSPGAITPDTISGTFPTLGAPTPPANISGVMPGTPAPGSVVAQQETVTPGAPPPGGAADTGIAPRSVPSSQPTVSSSQTTVPSSQSTLGFFTVPISPPSFSNFVGTGQVSPGIIATPPPLGTEPGTPTPPLLGSPAPLTAAPATPLLGTPAPLNVAPPPALITTPAPANAIPGATTATPVTPGAAVPPGPAPVSPGGTAVPPSI